MARGELVRVAEFLATHAVVLLGLGVLGALAALAAVVAAIRLAARYREPLRRGTAAVVRTARTIAVVDRAISRAGALVPSGYLVLHLTLGLILTGAATVFIVLAAEVAGGGALTAFDLAFAEALQERVTPGWRRVFTVVSWLGNGIALAVATAAITVPLVRRHGGIVAAGWMAAQAGGGLLNVALKGAFERTRPAFADPLLAASSWSFPSGHAMGTFVLCGLGCYLLLRNLRSWTLATVLVAITLSWCVVMSFSRLYLGAHFASDVVAGMIAGVAWVAVSASALEVIRQRRNPRAPGGSS